MCDCLIIDFINWFIVNELLNYFWLRDVEVIKDEFVEVKGVDLLFNVKVVFDVKKICKLIEFSF